MHAKRDLQISLALFMAAVLQLLVFSCWSKFQIVKSLSVLKRALLTIFTILVVVVLVGLGAYLASADSTATVTVRATLRAGDPPPVGWVLLTPVGSGSFTHQAVFGHMESFNPDSGTATVKIDGKKQGMLSRTVQYEIQVDGQYLEETKTIQIPVF